MARRPAGRRRHHLAGLADQNLGDGAGFAVVVALVVLLLIWSVIRLILRSPGLLSRHRQHRRGVRAYEAISNG